MLQIVTSTLSGILTSEEVAATTMRVVRASAGPTSVPLEQLPVVDEGDLLDEPTLLEYRVFDDRRGSWMQGRESAAELHGRFRSELQDFVAESGFGWGQWRP